MLAGAKCGSRNQCPACGQIAAGTEMHPERNAGYGSNSREGTLLVAGASFLVAGHVYGTIRDHRGAPVVGTPLLLVCPGAEPAAGKTDHEGVYRLFTRATGSCTLVLDPDGRRAESSLYSYDRPTAYDFDLMAGSGERGEAFVPASAHSDAGARTAPRNRR